MLVIRAGIHKMLVRIANMEVPDKTTSLEAVLIWVCTVCLSLFGRQVNRAGIHKMLVRIANREDPDKTTSLEAVLIWVCTVCLSLFGRQVNRAGIHKMLVRIANRENSDKTTSFRSSSDLGLHCLSISLWEAISCIYHLKG